MSVAIALDVIRVGVRESLLTGVEANDDIEAEACFRNKYSNVRSHLYASLKVGELGENLFEAKFRDFLLGENLHSWEKN